MQSKTQQQSGILLWFDFATCIYLPLLVTFLNYNNQILRVGHYEDIFVIFFIIGAEILKYLIYTFTNKSTTRRNIFKDIFNAISVSLVMFVAIYIVSVLFGAPVFSNIEQTVMFAGLVTSLTAFPVCLHLGYDNTVNMFLSLTSYQGNDCNELFMMKVRLTLFGAWLGAFVIPLDWKRPWQIWPIPCCIGALFGHIIGSVITSAMRLKTQGKNSKKTGKYTL